jgi:methionyl-tRNA formyltransferase
LRVVFAGTPPFAAQALEALVAAGHHIPLVLTQPDRPAGRGMRLAASAVSQVAVAHGLAVFKPSTLREPEAVARIAEARPDVMVVAAYGLILPRTVLGLPGYGCINIHASLLPRWRGAAPVQRALLAGDRKTGVSIMQMEAGLDTGPVLQTVEVEIAERETAGSLTAKLAMLGARAIVESLASIAAWKATPQDNAAATYAAKIARPDAQIDWTRANVEVDRQVRAFDPVPGAETRIGADVLKIWDGMPVPGRGQPGEVIVATGGRLVVACGDGALELTRVQRAGGKKLGAAEFLRGTAVTPGAVLGSAVSGTA